MTTAPPRPVARASHLARRAGAVLVVVLLLLTAWSWWDSRLPASYSAEQMGTPDPGLGVSSHQHGYAAPGAAAVPVTDLVAEVDGPADVHVELDARAEEVTPVGGRPFAGYTLDRTSPGPEIRPPG